MTTIIRGITKDRNLELNIKVNTGMIVLKNDKKIEIVDCNNFTIEEFEYILKEVKNFIVYKENTKILIE